MALYTELSDVHLTVATHCTVFFSARSDIKLEDLGKLTGTELHLSAIQKFLSQVSGLSARNVDLGVCVTKLRAIDRCKYL
jgi:hypothetical protein